MSYWLPPPERISVTISSESRRTSRGRCSRSAFVERLHPLRLQVALPRDHVQRAALRLRRRRPPGSASRPRGRRAAPTFASSSDLLLVGFVGVVRSRTRPRRASPRGPACRARCVEPSFCRTTVSRSPASVSTRLRVKAPTNTTSATVAGLAVAVQASIRSGRTEMRRPSRSTMFDVPTKPATNSVAGRS